MTEFNSRIKLKTDTEENWSLNNPVLLDGEIIIVKNQQEKKIKIGDGTTNYSNLPFQENGNNFIIKTITLDSSAWLENNYEISVPEVTQDNFIIISPTLESESNCIKYGIQCNEQSLGKLVFSSVVTPPVNVSFNLTIY